MAFWENSFTNRSVRWLALSRMSRIESFMAKAFEVQEKTLMSLIRRAKDTEWGKQFGYGQIKNYEQYQNKVPISTYEQIFPHIEKMMKGQQNILWGSPIQWFAKSSGTTNAKSKFIPVSRESLQTSHFRAGKDIISLFVHNRPKTNFFKGKGLSIGGTFQTKNEKSTVKLGDISAVVVQNLPLWVQYIRTPPLSIAMMDEWESKIEAMARYTIKQNITSILGVPTWTIVLLQRILEITGKQNIREVWGNLEVFVHGAVAFQPYKSYFKHLMGKPDIDYLETYNASEGFFAIQDSLLRDDLLLMLDYDIFYEFIPLEEEDNENPSIYSLPDIELHKNYAMVISSSTGLWRYKIGDTIKFTSKNPYRIKITGRTKHFINAFGEEVIVENAETAISQAALYTNAIIANYTAAPIYMADKSKGGHEWIIEFAKLPNDLIKFTSVLDETLQSVNSDYEAKRYKDMALQIPIVHSAPEGTFYNWLKQKGKLGGQHKVPRLSNSREYVDDILKLLKLVR